MTRGVFHSIFCLILTVACSLAQAQQDSNQPLVEASPVEASPVEAATPGSAATPTEATAPAPVAVENPEKQNSEMVNDLEAPADGDEEDAVIPATPEEVSKSEKQDQADGNAGKPILAKPKKVKSIWNGALIWTMFGLGSPGNELNFPSTHFELGLDLQYFDRIKLGPYYSKTTGSRSEYFYFANTGYEETRYYNVSSQVIGLQARGQAYETLHGRLAVGLSQTTFKVSDVETNAPVSSSALGYSKTYPLGIAFEAALQKNWSWLEWGVGVEWGFNMTSVFGSESFSEKYVGVVGRYFFGRAKSAKKFIPKKLLEPKTDTPPPATQ